jgi:hypothetical protein
MAKRDSEWTDEDDQAMRVMGLVICSLPFLALLTAPLSWIMGWH